MPTNKKRIAKRSRNSDTSMPKSKPSFLQWLDNNILLMLSGFLLAFIPLFPKIPFFSPIEQYIVRVRAEDVFVALAGVTWFIQLWRKKITLSTPLTWLIGAYISLSFLSLLAAMFIIGTIPIQPLHVAKSLLHFFRYIEYFSLFFIVFSSIRTKKDVQVLLGILIATLMSIAIYGYGQKYWYWPVYSTMNREFSKGVRLYLTDHARVQSTFAGHYDLAAYLVIVLPIILALAYGATKRWAKIGLTALHFIGVWLLIVGAARTSFAAYGISMSLVVLLFALRKKGLWKKISWGVSQMTLNGLATLLLLSLFGADIYERFVQVLDSYPAISSAYHETNKRKKEFFASVSTTLKLDQLAGHKAPPPPNSISTDEAVQVLVSSDERPVPYKPNDVYVDVPDKVQVATVSADGTTSYITVERPRTWSENSLRYGLSLGIRLDTLWPQAIKGFMRNPLLGSGYATLNKAKVDEFTIAESTDNNFLRTLGETGLLGFLTFYGAVVTAIVLAWKHYKSTDPLLKTLVVGYVAGAIGLLLNAVYIDVFASSKVAFTFWSITGLVLGYIVINRDTKHAKKPR
jgi:hypothetical protein